MESIQPTFVIVFVVQFASTVLPLTMQIGMEQLLVDGSLSLSMSDSNLSEESVQNRLLCHSITESVKIISFR